jgi:hypothetical protein
MPENNKNLCDGRTLQLVQQLGEAVMGGTDITKNPHQYEDKWNTTYGSNNFFDEVNTDVQKQTPIDPDCKFNYSFDSANCVD